MKRFIPVILIMLFISSISTAVTIKGIDIDFVTIGNPGNPGDTRTEANPDGCGAVSYTYQIGKYEITNGQWDAFVTAAGAPTGYPSSAYNNNAYWSGDDKPTTNVSTYEIFQFCNYLTSGDKSMGAYVFSGDNDNPSDFVGVDRETALTTYGKIYILPTENEWYKAAYYSPDGSGYSTYSNGNDIAPNAGTESNYDFTINQPWDVGSGKIEQNGTFDMIGNVWEWNETIISGYPGARGGAYNYDAFHCSSSYQTYHAEYDEIDFGFRIASIPEPATICLLSLGGLLLRRRK